ncbi:Dps family protein [Fundicoccus culcitae]|uniref:DNA starvation/stationary phase protection protein n=1 Tax=Fundicoccus culcitae TaxID=2969821 RepID=A0ABY5P3V4_9LACT|nr:DNA starvation/stationary phase protection protein [Fundicoccus culcitae]UUX33138.1 DNA starvation/stationary phase protection protein [Fundicoccus culcitae]
MSQNKTPQELLAQEQAYKEHIHHTKINAAAIIDHILGNIHTLHVKLHQYHWYVKGPQFYTLHEKFEALYDANEAAFDSLAELLIASGFKPASTTAELVNYSMLKEDAADKYLSAEEMVANIVEDLRSTRELTIRAISLAAEEGNAALEDGLINYKASLDKNIWMLQAFLGQDPFDGDDNVDEDDE